MIFVGSVLALGVFGVKHKPKVIAGTEERVSAVACPPGCQWKYFEL